MISDSDHNPIPIFSAEVMFGALSFPFLKLSPLPLKSLLFLTIENHVLGEWHAPQCPTTSVKYFPLDNKLLLF